MCFCFFFFFSSRRRHTRSLRDWSSDVCSSDLLAERLGTQVLAKPFDVEELQRAVSTVLADAREMRSRASMMRTYAQQVSVTSDRMREEDGARKARMNDLVAAGWEIHRRPHQES